MSTNSSHPQNRLEFRQNLLNDREEVNEISRALRTALSGVARSSCQGDEKGDAFVAITWLPRTVEEDGETVEVNAHVDKDVWPEHPNSTRIISILSDPNNLQSEFNHVITINELDGSVNIFAGVSTIKTACLDSRFYQGQLFLPSRQTQYVLNRKNPPTIFQSPTIAPRLFTEYGNDRWKIIDSRPSDTMPPRSGLGTPPPE